jgi:TusA-related sulfurtransferase
MTDSTPTRLDTPRESHLDITAETCPMTFVRTRLALDRLPAGGILSVRLLGEEPLRNVSANASLLGHTVENDGTDGRGITLLRITRR